MDAKMLKIKASQKQLSRLRNGHRVLIKKEEMEGGGINLLVNPQTYNPVIKAFSKNKGILVQLTPDEILLNKAQGADAEGSGIFGKKFDRAVGKVIGKKAQKVVYDVADKVGKPIVKKAIKDLQKYAPELGATALSGLATATGNPELAPMAAELGSKLGKIAGDAGASYANKKLDGKGLTPRGMGLTPVGVGLYTGSRVMGRGKLREVSSISCGGGLLRTQSHLPPALMSQPYSANFQFQHTLPPAYTQHIKGNGFNPA
jgi:hypothetical protein